MPQETVGYVNQEWMCKHCGSKNPGTTKICASCGNVMSATDKFELPAQQELSKDEAVQRINWRTTLRAVAGS